ncbi:glycoside hydrolase family protein [Pseudobutyrivibrio xylanivorans]|nr:glycoside hydrolase family 32 [Pseudobutyrivibrio xylanivorans]
MRRIIVMLLLGTLSLSCIGCSAGTSEAKQESEEQYLGESIDNHVVFPASVEGFVGDTMPFYDDGTYNIFYLADQRNGKQGYHPWAMMQTKDFVNYDDKGVVINYGETIKDQDIALGTGSVIKDKNGKYHAFYTGHNDAYEPKEAVMHAISDDLENWEKVPEDTFYANENYAKNDFRDPYVLYMEDEDCYWMLVTTRSNNTGVIAKYTSKDLKTWNDDGVFFENDMDTDSNMECPTLLKYKNKWYLSFSDQWPNRIVHYRFTDDLKAGFKKPQRDFFDGNGFYAGRMETDGERLFIVGWNGTKVGHADDAEYDWGGNMVTHELIQAKDGSLSPVMVNEVEASMTNSLAVAPEKMTESIKSDDNTLNFAGEEYEVAGFKKLLGSYIVSGKFKNFDENGMFGFAFNLDSENVGKLNIVFNAANKRIEFYNTDNIMAEVPQSYVDYDFGKMDELDVKMVIADGVVSMYVNNDIVFTERMYLSQGMEWGIFSVKSKVSVEDLKVYK